MVAQPQPQTSIRRASPSNAAEAIELIEEYYEAINVVARDNREEIQHYLEDPRSGIWLAWHGSAPVGCILYRPLPGLGAAGEVKRLYVRPDFRRQGLADALLEAVESFARERKIDWIYLDTKDDLKAAIAFYQRHGYESCPRYNDNPQATIFMRKAIVDAPLVLRSYEPGDEEAFRQLNEIWITKYFGMEDSDRKVLYDPGRYVLGPGGHIFMALRNGKPVGCCALLAMDGGVFELAKMTVSEDERGRGIGRALLSYAIEQAKSLGAASLYLETNHTLSDAIHLYEALGFLHLPPERVHPSPYARVNVFMELNFA
jgi:GNAT superfamily N-acetyltransferase